MGLDPPISGAEREAGLAQSREAAQRISSLVRAVRMYPPGHPRVEAATNVCLEFFQNILSSRPGLFLLAHFDDLLCECGCVSEGDRLSKELVPELRKRQIRMIHIARGVTGPELLTLGQVIAKDPREVASLGGPRQVVLDSDARCVELIEFQYVMSGLQLAGQSEDPEKAIEHMKRVLAFRRGLEELIGRGELEPADAAVIRKAFADQHVVEKSLMLDGRGREAEDKGVQPPPSLMLAEKVVNMIKASGAGVRRIGAPAISTTLRWVLDSASRTIKATTSEEPSDAILEDIAKKMFASRETFADFLRVHSQQAGGSEPGMAELLKSMFAHTAWERSSTPMAPQEMELRGAPETRAVHQLLPRLQELSEREDAGEPVISELDMASSVVDSTWQVLCQETAADTCRRLGTRLAHAVTVLEPEARSAVIRRVLRAVAQSREGGAGSPRLLGCREAITLLDTAEVVRAVLGSETGGQEKSELLEALSELKPEAVPAMVDLYFQFGPGTDTTCLVPAISGRSPYAISALREKIKTQSAAELRGLGRLLSALKDESAVGLLDDLSHHADSSVARAALYALAENGSPAAAATLVRRCRTRDRETRKVIIFLLGKVHHPDCVAALCSLARRRDVLGHRTDERVLAVDSLGRLGCKEIEPYLKKLARRRGLFRRRTAARLRKAAERALGRLEVGTQDEASGG